MSTKNPLAFIIFGWLPKEPNMPHCKLSLLDHKTAPKSWLWKTLWVTTSFFIVASCILTYFLLYQPLFRAAGGLVLTVLYLGITCYLRVKPSSRINQAVYLVLGITPIGFVLWVTSVSALNNTLLHGLGSYLAVVLYFIACIGLGAFVGDWIGKRERYMIPFTLLKSAKNPALT
jgi:hypothetical protein